LKRAGEPPLDMELSKKQKLFHDSPNPGEPSKKERQEVPNLKYGLVGGSAHIHRLVILS